jgi:hypothetical protein
MTDSYWLAQTVAVSQWLDSRVGGGVTMVDRAPGFFSRSIADRSRNEPGKIANVLVIVTRPTSV